MQDQKIYSFEEYMSWVRRLSNELGFSVASVTPGAERLFHAAQGTKVEKEVLWIARGVLILTSVDRLDYDEVFDVFSVLAQCIVMGGVNSVNLKLQLCKHVPDAFDLFAKAKGVTRIQLNEEIEKGSLDISVLKKFSREVEKKYGNLAVELSKSGRAKLARLGNTLRYYLS